MNVRPTVGVALFLLVGCGSWGRRPVDETTPIKPNQPVWIWTRYGVEKWGAVVVTRDSVSGTLWGTHCDECRISFPRALVDSMKVGPSTHNPSVLETVGVVAGAILVEAVVCSVIAPHDRDC